MKIRSEGRKGGKLECRVKIRLGYMIFKGKKSREEGEWDEE